jgi:hypothetical protein
MAGAHEFGNFKGPERFYKKDRIKNLEKGMGLFAGQLLFPIYRRQLVKLDRITYSIRAKCHKS